MFFLIALSLLTQAAAPAPASPAASAAAQPARPAAASSALGAGALDGLVFRPEVGKWAEYDVTVKGEPTRRVRFSVVGKESAPVEAYWLEIALRGPGRDLVLKVLTVGGLGAKDGIRRLIAQLGPGMVMELPVPADQSQPGAASQIREVGSAVVKTRAGSFNTKIRSAGATTSYVASEVPIYGLVKGKTEDSQTELVAFGDGARSEIVSEPQTLANPLMPAAWGKPPEAGGK